ncbi:MAG: T9SS type A sorting domain-containing protein [Bacteroidota bacterium]
MVNFIMGQLRGQTCNTSINGFNQTSFCGTEDVVNMTASSDDIGPIYTFSISPRPGSGFSSSGGSASFNPSQVGAGTYTITLKKEISPVCNEEIVTVIFTVNQVETIDIEVENLACAGSSLDLAFSETLENVESQTWTGPNNFSSSLTFPSINNATSLNSGTYNVTVTYETGCVATASRSITINTSPAFELTSNAPSCEGENLNLGVNGEPSGGTYSWTGPNNFTSDAENVNLSALTPDQAGMYSLTYTTNEGCTATESVAITLSELPQPSIISAGDFCGGDANLVLEDNSNFNYQYNWQNQTSGADYEGKVVTIDNPSEEDAGLYTVSVTNSAGCEVTETIEIEYKGDIPNLVITGDSEVCSGTNIILSETGEESQNYNWTGPNSFQSVGSSIEITGANAINSGVYRLVADNGNGCVGTASVLLTVSPSPDVAIEVSDSEPCEGADIQLREVANDLVSWNWTGPNNFSSSDASPSLSNISVAASGTYTLQATNEAGCQSESSVSVDVVPSFNAGTGLSTQVCSGPVVDLTTLLVDSDVGGVFTNESSSEVLSGINLPTENLSPGLYQFTYAAAEGNSCTSSTDLAVRILAAPEVGLSVPTSFCQGDENIVLEDTLIQSMPLTYTWTNETTGNRLNGQRVNISNPLEEAAGSYTLRVVGENSCVLEESFTINYNGENPALVIEGDSAVCVGNTLQLKEVGEGGQNYFWTGPNGFTATDSIVNLNDANSANAGSYTLRVDNGNGCTVEQNVEVRVNPLPLVVLDEPTGGVCQGTDVQLAELGGELINWNWTGPNNFVSNESEPLLSAVDLAATGTYRLTGTNENGCSASSSLFLQVSRSFNAGTSRDSQVCRGTDVDLSILLSEADSGGIFVDENNTGQLAGTILTTMDLLQGDYNFTYTLAESSTCIGSTSFFVRVQEAPSAGEDVRIDWCQNDILALNTVLSPTASSGGVFTEEENSGGLMGNSFDGSTLIATEYELIYQVGAGDVCPKDEATISINLNPTPKVPDFRDQDICVGERLTLTATEGTNYQWTTGATSQSIDIRPLATTDYGVTVTNEFNCSIDKTTTIVVNDAPILVTSSDATICAGSSVPIIASGAIEYNWTPNAGLSNSNIATPVASPDQSTTYQVVGINELGCRDTTQVNIFVNEQPTLTVGENTTICSGTGTNLRAEGMGTVTWTPATGLDDANSRTPFANPTTTSDYQAILVDENGCTDTGTVQVIVEALPDIGLGADQTICAGDSLALAASGGETYLWESSDLLANPTSPNQVVNPVEPTTYRVTVIGANECSNTDSLTVFVNETPVAGAGDDQLTCFGVGATLTGNGEGAYQWDNGATTAVIEVNPTESTTYTLQVTNEFGCSDTDEVLVNVQPDFEVQTSPDTFLCSGVGTQLTAAGGVRYSWRPIEGLDNSEIATPIAAPTINTTYEVSIQNQEGCVVQKTIDIEVKQVDNLVLSPDQDVCEGNKVTLTAEGGINYDWFPNNAFENPNQPSQELQPTENTTYRVVVVDEFGCQASDSVRVTIRPTPTVTVEAEQERCAGENLELTGEGTGVTEWLWEGNNFSATQQNAQVMNIRPNQSGQFKLIGTSEFGCKSADSVQVRVYALPQVTIETTETICENTPFVLTSSDEASNQSWVGANGATFSGSSWDLGLAELSFTGNYQLFITDEQGCSNRVEKIIEVVEAPRAGRDSALVVCQGTAINISELLRDADDSGIFLFGNGLSTATDGGTISTIDLSEGTYGLTYEVAADFCPAATAQFQIEVEVPKMAGLDNSISLCQGSTLDLLELVQMADVGGNFVADNEAVLDGSLFTSTQLPAGTYPVKYVQSNTCGTNEATLEVTVLTQVQAGDNVQVDLCPDSPLDLSTLLTMSDPNGVFQDLSNSGALVDNLLETEELPFGTYNFSYRVNSDNECPSDSALITLILKDSLSAGQNNAASFCTGAPITLTELLLEGDIGGIFSPVGAGPANFMGTTIPTEGLNSTNYTFEYSVGGKGCPADTALIEVVINESPSINFTQPDSFLCLGDSLLLEATVTGGTGLIAFEWQTPSGSSQGNSFIAKEAGAYVVVATDDKTCSDTKATTIATNEFRAIEIDGRTTLCQDEDLLLQPLLSDTTLNYSWLLPDGRRIDGSVLTLGTEAVLAGNYELVYTDAFNCQQVTTAEINFSPGAFFKSNFLTTNIACVGDSLHFIEIAEVPLSSTAVYRWDFGDGQSSTERDPVHNYQSEGLFAVSVEISDRECTSTSFQKEVNIVSCRKNIFDASPFDYLNIYPNPSSGNTQLAFDLNRTEQVLIEVFDLYGKRLETRLISGQSFYRGALMLEESGIYFVHLNTLSAKRVLKLVVNL